MISFSVINILKLKSSTNKQVIFVEGYLKSKEESEKLEALEDVHHEYDKVFKIAGISGNPGFADEHVRHYFENKHEINTKELGAILEVFDDGDHEISRDEYKRIYNYLKNDVEPRITLYKVNALVEINQKLDVLLGEQHDAPVPV
jgi:hypothetical protein